MSQNVQQLIAWVKARVPSLQERIAAAHEAAARAEARRESGKDETIAD
jgi:hypothetical protein